MLIVVSRATRDKAIAAMEPDFIINMSLSTSTDFCEDIFFSHG